MLFINREGDNKGKKNNKKNGSNRHSQVWVFKKIKLLLINIINTIN